jgi:hypothetical protein
MLVVEADFPDRIRKDTENDIEAASPLFQLCDQVDCPVQVFTAFPILDAHAITPSASLPPPER